MQMNNQLSDWYHYTDYKTWCFTINPQSAYIKKKMESLLHSLGVHTHQNDVCVCVEDEPYMEMKGWTVVSTPDSDFHITVK